MKISLESFFNDKHAPYYQASLLLLLILIGNLASIIVESTGLREFDDLFPWVISGAVLMVYALMSTLIGLATKVNMASYYGKSLTSFIGLALAGKILATAFSSIPMSEAGSMWWIYVVITVCYVVFLGLMMAMKKIVEFAQNEDENFRKNKK